MTTKQEQTSNWCFTLNNYTEEEVESVKQIDCKYIIFGKEIGESGTPHLQGYVNLSRTRHLPFVAKLIPRAHWEPCRGTPAQNIEYCSKGGDVWSNGTPPMDRKKAGSESGGKRTRENWEHTLEMARNGRVDEIDAEIQIKYYRTLKTIEKDHGKRPPDMDAPSDWKGILWIAGQPGTGKSRYVRSNWGSDEIYDKSLNKWWDGYRGEKIVLLDDFDKNHKVLGSHIKRWGDRYSFPAETKGGKMDIRPERIVITSNYLPETIWDGDNEMIEAIMRRTELMLM